MQKISTIIPVKNEEGNIVKLSQKILDSLKKFDNELIFVDDGSTDNTQKKIINLKKKYGKKIKGIIFNKNYGHQAALLAGLKLANGDYVGICFSGAKPRCQLHRWRPSSCQRRRRPWRRRPWRRGQRRGGGGACPARSWRRGT